MNAFLALAFALAGAGDVEVLLTHERHAVDKPPKAVGSDFLDTRLALDNLKLWHRVAVDPKAADEPVRFGYGDFFFGCDFGRQGNGGWNLWSFTGASVAAPEGKPLGLYRRAEGFHVVERGTRAMADVCWWLDGGPKQRPDDLVTMRFVKLTAEPEWFYLETSVESPAPLALASAWYSAFPANTTGPPARERWLTTAARSQSLMKGGADLDPATEWTISLHNKNGDEWAGSLLVFDPDEVAKARVEGTYGVTIRLTPKPGRTSLHVAVSYFLREHYERANAAFLAAAPTSLDRLRKLAWQADLARLDAAWRRELSDLAEPLRLAADDADVTKRLDAIRLVYDQALAEAKAAADAGKPVPRAAQRRLADALQRLHAARDAVFAAAVKVMLEEME